MNKQRKNNPPAQEIVDTQPIQQDTETPKVGFKPTKWLIALMAAVAMAVTFFVYTSAFKNDFVDWDDYAYVIDNELIRNEKIPNSEIWQRPISLNYHPLTIQTMRWHNNKCEKCSEGISAKPFIQGNVWLHTANVGLVFALIYALSGGIWWVALFCALWFGIHPLHVESVAWVSERKDVLYVFFSLLGLLSFNHFHSTGEKKWGFWLITLMLSILACLSKAMAVVNPLLMMLIIYWKSKPEEAFLSIEGILNPKRLAYFAPLLAISLFFGLMAVKIQSGDNFLGLLKVPTNTAVAINEFKTFNILERLHFAAYGYTAYFTEFFLPNDLCTFYPYPTRVEYNADQLFYHSRLLFMLGTIGLVGLGLFKKDNEWIKTATFGIGFYFLAVVLVLQFLSVGVVIKADRYSYFPYVGLIFMLLMFWKLLMDKNQLLQIVGLVIALGLSGFFFIKTQKQIATWQNSEALWTQVISTQAGKNLEQPYSVRGHAYGKMADKAAKAGQMDKVQFYLDKAFNDFQACVTVGTQRGEVFEGLGNIYGMRQNYPKALENYDQAAILDPKKATIYYNRGVTHSILKNWEKAITDYNRSEELGNEKLDDLRRNRALAAINARQFAVAIKDLDILCQQSPNDYAHFANRGVCKAQLGDKAAAKADFERALQRKPNDEFTLNQLNALK